MQMFGHMTKMDAISIYGKTPLKSSLGPDGQLPWDSVYSILDVWPTKLIQMMILGKCFLCICIRKILRSWLYYDP